MTTASEITAGAMRGRRWSIRGLARRALRRLTPAQLTPVGEPVLVDGAYYVPPQLEPRAGLLALDGSGEAWIGDGRRWNRVEWRWSHREALRVRKEYLAGIYDEMTEVNEPW